MSDSAPGTREEWLKARKSLLEEEKAYLRAGEELASRRRALPWVKVDQEYHFQTNEGERTLSDLFGGRSQLIVQHFMMGADWDAGCPSCSFWADGYDGMTVHIEQRDIAFVAVSRGPLAELNAYKTRMGWDFEWVSSAGSDFNFDYNVSATEEQLDGGEMTYNFRAGPARMSELPGTSVFARNGAGEVFHTYSTYGRGLDPMNNAYAYMDLTPKGRDESGLPYTMAWLKRHDEYTG
jgi:predicted dithiol-disulfide oxidoreductase (DUF899 family)